MRACVRACVHACVRVCVCVCVFLGLYNVSASLYTGARTDHWRQTEDVAECLGIAPSRDQSTTLRVSVHPRRETIDSSLLEFNGPGHSAL